MSRGHIMTVALLHSPCSLLVLLLLYLFSGQLKFAHIAADNGVLCQLMMGAAVINFLRISA